MALKCKSSKRCTKMKMESKSSIITICKLQVQNTILLHLSFARKERNAFQKLIERVTRVDVNDKPGGANDRLDRQNLGARHFAVGGYPGTELIMMNISIISMVK